MPIYWTIRSVPELAPLPEEERSRLIERCLPRVSGCWQTRSAYACAFALALAGAAGGAILGWLSVAQGGALAPFVGGLQGQLCVVFGGLALGGGLGSLVGGGILGQVKASLLRPHLRAELQSPEAKAHDG
jgi:hypothetical protein